MLAVSAGARRSTACVTVEFSVRGEAVQVRLTKAQPAIMAAGYHANASVADPRGFKIPASRGPNRARLHSQVSDAVDVSAPNVVAKGQILPVSTILETVACWQRTTEAGMGRASWSG